jgi:hypothetical protein
MNFKFQGPLITFLSSPWSICMTAMYIVYGTQNKVL